MPPAEASDPSQRVEQAKQQVEQAKQQGQELLARGEVMVADMLRGYLGQFQEYIGGSTTQQPVLAAAALLLSCADAAAAALCMGLPCAEEVVCVQVRPGSWPYRLWSLAWTRP